MSYESFNELEDEVKQEFYEDVKAAIKDINECATILESGADAGVIDRMFRALHTVKGNCNMVFLERFVDASHKLEDLFSDIRSGTIDYDDIYGQFAVVAVSEIEKQLDSLVQKAEVDENVLERLEQIIDQIENNQSGQRLAITEKAIIAVQDGHFNLDLVAINEEHGRAFSFLDATDSEFFEFISDRQAHADPLHEQFMSICNTLALKLNEKLGRRVDEDQLSAAVIFLGLSRLIAVEKEPGQLTIEQVFFASGLLSRMSGWSVAAELVLQSSERHDGTGLPLGLSNDKILPAAQVIGLAFEFTFIVLQNRQQGYKQSLFTAVKAINAQKDTRFKARLIERFNNLVKSEYLTTQMW
ncbi:Hpt domain-containing protein [Aliikangiella coralliicola]|uniref:HPt domain-containing protein n=1 Tax=Aliikangiella coralliicola TaxID=2592383 RepID=A0A545TW63_9GAMM|nr:Hpt domain-containing protein [Aliikangiella coralliicola]TQV81467.1 hypothetical protein FLL46_25280 [Aliikangiella coralliicola]